MPPQRSLKSRTAALAQTAALAASIGLTACDLPAPSVRCQANGVVEVSAPRLGIYPSPHLMAATLTDTATGNIVWTIEGQDDLRLRMLVFRESQRAAEPVHLSHGRVRVLMPETQLLILDPSTTYELTLNSGNNWFSRRPARFLLAQCSQ